MFPIIVSFLLLCSPQGGARGQLDMNNVNLQEDVAQPTESSCGERRRRSVKRSTNESLHGTPPPFDDCMVYPYFCPDHVRISWLQAPPFLYDANGNSNKAVFGTWPVVLMAFLMSSVAGVLIWVLVSTWKKNRFAV